MRRLQIGVIGSCSDLNSSVEAEIFAKTLGELIAGSENTLVYGAEKDINSLPTIAAQSAKDAGGETLAFTYEKGMELFCNDAATVVIATGLVRGGGRELSLMLSCDVVIALSGGSGTLNEICVAYQASIPVITVTGLGGWADTLSDTFLDDRKRYRFIGAKTPKSALQLALKLLAASSV
jgi:uncharacterized protein (TIGR00725 family)